MFHLASDRAPLLLSLTGWLSHTGVRRSAEPAPLIALVGCDGSGKSTLSADLTAWLAQFGPTTSFYLGLGTGDLGRRIAKWPIVGHWIEPVLSKKAKKTRTPGEKIPGPVTALVVFGLSLMRFRRFAKAQKLRRRGVTVITDRYPQAELGGLFDGPGLSAARPGDRFVAALARWERRLYDRMAEVRPNLLVRLDVDAQTAYARKPDHVPALLQQKITAMRGLTFNGAPFVTIDASAPYADVLRRVQTLCEDRFAAAFARKAVPPPVVTAEPLCLQEAGV